MILTTSAAASPGKALGPGSRAIAEALGKRIIPPGGDIPYSLHDTNTMDFLDNYIAELGGQGKFIKLLLWVMDLCPILFIGKPSRFLSLSEEDQDRVLEKWQDSRIYYVRMAMLLFKTVIEMGYFNEPKVLDAIGYYDKCEVGSKS